jgi:hypothetical protein
MKIQFTIKQIDIAKIRTGVQEGDIIVDKITKERTRRHPKHKQNLLKQNFED